MVRLRGRPYHQRKARRAADEANLALACVTCDRAKGRRQLYRLAPAVQAEMTPAGRTLDFGCCILRCPPIRFSLPGAQCPVLRTNSRTDSHGGPGTGN